MVPFRLDAIKRWVSHQTSYPELVLYRALVVRDGK